MSRAPRVVFGIPLHNGADNLAETLESLLSQTVREIALVLVDDASSDTTPEIVQRYAALDDRISYERSDRRLGMIGAWRRAQEAALERFPDAEYFAWASDHDVWHPAWVEELVAVLDAEPDVVLAYPMDIGVSDDWDLVRKPWRFESAWTTSVNLRLRATIRGMSAGNMVYGLARREALTEYRYVLLPDKLYLYELALRGPFRQVPRVLWYRRYRPGVVPSLERQRRSFFPDQVPRYTYVPWWLVHGGVLIQELVVRRGGPTSLGRWPAVRAAAEYVALNELIERRKNARRIWNRIRRSLLHGLRVRPALRLLRRAVRAARWRLDRVGRLRLPALGQVANSSPVLPLPTAKPTPVAQTEGVDLAEAEREILMIKHRRELKRLGSEKRAASIHAKQLSGNPDYELFHRLVSELGANRRSLLDPMRLYTILQATTNAIHLGGAIVEAGTYRGGSAWFMANAFREISGKDPELHVFDTFAGHPPTSLTNNDSDAHRDHVFRDTSSEDVERYLADFPGIQVHVGDVMETAPAASIDRVALLHLDLDLYRPTLAMLRHFAPLVTVGGTIVVDDYGAKKCPGVAKAINEFLAENNEYQLWRGIQQAVMIRDGRTANGEPGLL